MTNQEIFDFFVGVGMTPEGAAATEANIRSESSMIPNIAQRGMTRLTDAQYTAAADSGAIDFDNDRVGYGYFQHTYPSRKKKLRLYAKEFGVSVGDPMMQLNFAVTEMREDYPGVWQKLTTSHDLFACTQIVCNVYENPAVKNVGTRYEYAQEFFNECYKHKAAPSPKVFPIDGSVATIQYVMHENGYWGDITGQKSNEFFQKLREFTDDMQKC